MYNLAMRSNKTLSYFLRYIKKLPQLNFKEKYILARRLRKKTLEGIGKKFSVTEARVRQIEKIAITKIKRGIYQQELFKNEKYGS